MCKSKCVCVCFSNVLVLKSSCGTTNSNYVPRDGRRNGGRTAQLATINCENIIPGMALAVRPCRSCHKGLKVTNITFISFFLAIFALECLLLNSLEVGRFLMLYSKKQFKYLWLFHKCQNDFLYKE